MTKLEALGLIETTSEVQRRNGTRRFHDPITTCDYMSYESGYIRREYVTTSWRTGSPLRTMYQLNPTRKGEYVSPYTGRKSDTVERVMIHDPNERLERIAKAVANYRKTCAGYQAQRDAYAIEQEREISRTVASDSVNMFIEGFVDLDQTIINIKSTLVEIKEKGLIKNA